MLQLGASSIKLGTYGSRHAPSPSIPGCWPFRHNLLGGPGLEQFGVRCLDCQVNIFLCGYTQTPASPSLDPFQQTNLSAQQAAIIKMNSDASKILFFSVFSSGYGGVADVDWDSIGNLVIVGGTPLHRSSRS